jgi:hypothetical protein
MPSTEDIVALSGFVKEKLPQLVKDLETAESSKQQMLHNRQLFALRFGS